MASWLQVVVCHSPYDNEFGEPKHNLSHLLSCSSQFNPVDQSVIVLQVEWVNRCPGRPVIFYLLIHRSLIISLNELMIRFIDIDRH